MLLKQICKFFLCCSLLFLLLSGCTSSNKKQVSDEESAAIYLQLGVRYLSLNKLDIAKQNLEKALDYDSHNVEAHNSMAFLYQKLNMIDDAIEHFEEALSLAPNNIGVQNNYGHFLCERRKFTEGVFYLQKAIANPMNDRIWQALSNIGFCQLQQGNRDKAEISFRAALNNKSDYVPALAAMQKISYQKGDYWAAKAFLERYLSSAQPTAETLWHALQTERALGHEKMVNIYRRQLFTDFPTSSEAKQIRKHLQ